MKIQRFLIFIQDTLLNYPDISISTLRKIVNSFEKCLSNKERENETTMLLFRVIREIGLKQISLKTINNKIITNNLVNELNNLKDEKI